MSTHVTDELLSAEVDGALSASEAEAVAEHVETCAACRRRREQMRGTARAIADLPLVEMPALDLSFLPRAPAAPVVLTPARWRPPTWVAPVAAAAALLLVAFTFGPALFKGNRGANTSAGVAAPQPKAGASAEDSRLFDVPAGSLSGAPAPGAVAPGAANGVQVGPGRATTTLDAGGTQSYPQAGGLVLRIGPPPSSVGTGHTVVFNMEAEAGQPVQLSSLYIQVRQGAATGTVARSTAPALGGGGRAGLSASWSAGDLGGRTAPGDYQVEGHAVLADGRDFLVSMTIHVS